MAYVTHLKLGSGKIACTHWCATKARGIDRFGEVSLDKRCKACTRAWEIISRQRATIQCNEYMPLSRPASFCTLPDGVTWTYVKAPSMAGLANRPDLPRASNPFGVIRTSRPLTTDECEHFSLRPI